MDLKKTITHEFAMVKGDNEEPQEGNWSLSTMQLDTKFKLELDIQN